MDGQRGRCGLGRGPQGEWRRGQEPGGQGRDRCRLLVSAHVERCRTEAVQTATHHGAGLWMRETLPKSLPMGFVLPAVKVRDLRDVRYLPSPSLQTERCVSRRSSHVRPEWVL